jgi:polar amino acid transport system substrate-binding protein
LVFLLGLLPWGAFAQVGPLVYSTNPQYPPYDWAVGDEAFAGASVALLTLVLPPEVKTKALVVPWKRAQDMAKDGAIDLLLSLRITPERSTYLEFTTHRAFPNPIVVFVRKESGMTLKSWDDLKGHWGGVSAGDTFGAGFDEYWKSSLQVEEAPSMVENFRKLDRGRIDWFVTGLYLGKAYLATHRLDHEIVALEPPISTGDIYLGFSKASPWKSLIPQVSRRLEELDKNGELVKLLQVELGRMLSAPAGSFPGE